MPGKISPFPEQSDYFDPSEHGPITNPYAGRNFLQSADGSYDEFRETFGDNSYFCRLVNYFAWGVPTVAGGISLAPIFSTYFPASAYLKTSLVSGTINSTMNLTSQLAVNGDVDLISTMTAFGSGFLPGSSAISILRNSMIAGGVDAAFNYDLTQGFRSVFTNKSLALTTSDFFFGNYIQS